MKPVPCGRSFLRVAAGQVTGPLVRGGAMLTIALGLPTTRAEVTLPRVIGDHMVLQRDTEVPIWGQATPGENITVRFDTQTKTTSAGTDGRWQVSLDAMPAAAKPGELTISGTNTLHVADVLVGEVWICSGQSNMEYALEAPKRWAPPATKTDAELAADVAASEDAPLRLFLVDKKLQPPDVVSAGWQRNAGETRAQFSAVGWVFGRRLQRDLGVPVGMIAASWGGSRIEEWTPDEAYARLETIFTGDAAISFEKDKKFVGRNYDAMVRPLAPFALRGVIWYQGESQLLEYNDGIRYADKMQTFVASWRAAWGRPGMPFYAVQIAPFLYSPRPDKLPHTTESLPELWEAQMRATAIPHTGVVPTSDLIGDLRDIHPAKKRIVGERLAALALAQTYGRKDIVYAGPEFDRLEIKGAEAIVHFKHAEGGLTTRDGHAPVCFDIAGEDGKWASGWAEIRGDTVVVTQPGVKAPVAVRLAWHETAQPNLTNRAGWPAFPFRTNGPAWSPR